MSGVPSRRPRPSGSGLVPLLLWLWKILPLPRRVRRAYLELTHPLFLVGVMALIRDEQGRVLILEHTYRRKDTWGLPGGYLKAREEPAAGLAREVAEETGLEVEVGELLMAGLYDPHQLDLLYRARISSGHLRPTPEVSSWRFVPERDLEHILPNQLAMLRRAGEVGSPRWRRGFSLFRRSFTRPRQAPYADRSD